MSKLQQALRDGRLNEIETKLFVKTKRHPQYPNLVMFKYDMINSPMGVDIVQECRGIILDESKNWEIVARPFDKFFNYGEGHAAEIDWSKAKVQEKLDGSLMILYWYDGVWQVASSGLPDAGGAINNYTTTFRELFWKIWNDNGYELPNYTYQNFTFMFEMMTPYNRVVVPHTESKLALIGVRHKVDGHEMSVDAFAGQDWPYVKSFPLQTMEDVVASFDKFDGIDQEGYVVFDGVNRVKVKHPGYVAIHHLKGDDGPSHKKMFNIVVTGESSEVLNYFPEWKPIYDEVSKVFEDTLAELAVQYVEITRATALMFPPGVVTNPARVQKEFAAMAVKTKCPDALFKMRAGKVATFREYFAGIGVEHVMKIMGKREWTINVP